MNPSRPKHGKSSPFAGRTVRLRNGFIHPNHVDLSGQEYRVIDWWDKITGGSWMWADGNPAAMWYGIRTGTAKYSVPSDDEVLYGHWKSMGMLVHVSEIVEEKA